MENGLELRTPGRLVVLGGTPFSYFGRSETEVKPKLEARLESREPDCQHL